MNLVFRSIDLEAHAELCVHFRRDAFVCSFDDGDKVSVCECVIVCVSVYECLCE